MSEFILDKIIPTVGIKPFPLDELSLMISAFCWTQPTHVFEWGTHVGKSARIFYESAKYFKIPTEIHSIDLPEEIDHVEHPHKKRGKLVRGKKDVFLHLGDGLNTSLEIYKKLPAENRVLFFVDGDHSYESVKRELLGIIENAPTANVLLHDTFYQSDESGYNIGPYKAIKDVLNEKSNHDYKIIETKTGLPGMTFLYKKP
jgi:cephalosporin hydroxylase